MRDLPFLYAIRGGSLNYISLSSSCFSIKFQCFMSICFGKFSTAEWYCVTEGKILFVCFKFWLKGPLSIFKNHFRESSLDKTFLVASLSNT